MANQKKIGILGSTGSIGTQALDIIRKNPEGYRVNVLSCARNIPLLEEQLREFEPVLAVTKEEIDARELAGRFPKTEFAFGEEGLKEAAALSGNDLVLNSLVGMQGLVPTLSAIEAGKDVALANKETLVAGGDLVMRTAAEKGVKILPVDSEHSAVFQSLQGNESNPYRKIILTASGGPFRGYTREMLKKVTLKDALKHPNWSMGNKITIDSATLMNKGLEVIEAHHLFDAPPDKIDVVVHPQSIIHSMVEYEDRAVMAQLGLPDMRVPIAYAFAYPERIPMEEKSLDLAELSRLTFEKPDREVFRTLDLAYGALQTGGGACCTLNAANEELVGLFLKERISFTDIQDRLVDWMMDFAPVKADTLEDILALDRETRIRIRETVRI
ncbi:MAG: 1-deoxy-D-xylulose-5-phosphate reductoisomerase [Firmicutes bacterium]|nr:1-deoxy-D-xylulose-5-phosphate reductoisomerase [Bacillota bacterium]